MNTWTISQKQRFISALSSLWPGGWLSGAELTDKARNWVSVGENYQIDIAIEALDDIYRNSETGRVPGPSAFREACRSIKAYCDNAARNKREMLENREPTFTGSQIAEDYAFWESNFDRAQSPEQLQWLKKIREKLRSGAKITCLLNVR